MKRPIIGSTCERNVRCSSASHFERPENVFLDLASSNNRFVPHSSSSSSQQQRQNGDKKAVKDVGRVIFDRSDRHMRVAFRRENRCEYLAIGPNSKARKVRILSNMGV